MQTTLPREIQVIDLWPASIRFILPRRDLRQGRLIGWLLMVLGLAGMGSALYLVLAISFGVPWVLGGFLKQVAFGLGFLTVGGLVPLWWGLAALFGHRELEIRGEYLRTIERVGPF